MNSRKREYSDVLDPFFLAHDLFLAAALTGHIYPSLRQLAAHPMRIVEETIERLGLDDPQCRELRRAGIKTISNMVCPPTISKKRNLRLFGAKRIGGQAMRIECLDKNPARLGDLQP